MQIFTVQHIDAEGHWCFLASFIDRLDLIEFIDTHRQNTRIMCGDSVLLDVRRFVPETLPKRHLATAIYELTEYLMPKEVA